MCLDDRERWRAEREYLYLDDAYPRALIEAGAQPVLLPVGSDAEAQVDQIDGLVLPGGDDFLPAEPDSYGETVRFDPVAPRQLDFDRALLVAALKRKSPFSASATERNCWPFITVANSTTTSPVTGPKAAITNSPRKEAGTPWRSTPGVGSAASCAGERWR